MFNFNYYFLIYFLKHNLFDFRLFHKDKCHILNELLIFDDIKFIYNKSLKIILANYLLQQALLFLSFIVLGFFMFASMMNVLHFDSFIIGLEKTLNDFISFHYVSLFIISLSLFATVSCINIYILYKINTIINKLQKTYFPVSHYFPICQSDLEKLHSLPIYETLNNNNNLYGLLLLLVIEKHMEKEEIKHIPDYFKKHW